MSSIKYFVEDIIREIKVGIEEFNKISTQYKAFPPSMIRMEICIDEEATVSDTGKQKAIIEVDIDHYPWEKETQERNDELCGPSKEEVPKVNEFQYQELLNQLEGLETLASKIMETHKIITLADLPASEYNKVRSKIDKIKRIEEQYSKQN